MLMNEGSTEFAPVPSEGWTLLRSPNSEYWVTSLDLAERAELKPAVMRSLLRKAIKDKKMVLATAGNHKMPHYRVVFEVVATPKGASKMVATYYLSQDAVLVVLHQLGNAKAAMVAGSVIRAFLAQTNPELFPPNVRRSPNGPSRAAHVNER